MDFIILMLLITACFWLYACFRKRNDYFKELGIPYVPPLPLLGNMAATALRRKHITDTIRDIYNYQPDAKYIGAFDFIRPVLVIRDPELIKNITIKHFDNFPDHPSFVDSTVDPIFGTTLFSLTGDKWREARNLLTAAFTASKVKAMSELIVQCTDNYINYIAEQAKSPTNMIGTKDLFTRFTNDAIAICAFGINVDSLKSPMDDFYVLGREATNFEGFLALKLFVSRAFPQLAKLFRMKIVSDHVKRFFMDIVEATVEMRDTKGINRPDMLQLMMEARGKSYKHLKLDITEMTAQIFIFFFGGFETSSTQMCIMAHELTINPDIQAKLQAEIDNVLAETNGQPTYEAINAMPYLDAVFIESVRRHTQAIGGVMDRVCIEAFELPPALPGGEPFTVQPGMNVWIPAAAVNLDEKYHENPKKFEPNRYLGKNLSPNQVENLGFGIGPRSCIGKRFAAMKIKILFFYLLSKFTLKPNAKTCMNFEYDPSILIVVPKGGYWLTVESRIKGT